MNNGSVVPQPDRRVVPWDKQMNRHSWEQEQPPPAPSGEFIEENGHDKQIGIAARLMAQLRPDDPIHNGKAMVQAFLDCHRKGGDVNMLRYFLEGRGIDHAVLNAAAIRAGKLWEKERPAIIQRTNGLHQAPETPAKLESADASAYTMRAVRWFWPNRFALGKIGLLGGLPDRGKGLIISDIISRATKGEPWPCNEGHAIQGNAVLLTAEDDIEDTIIPRLAGAGTDLSRVHIIKMVKHRDNKRMFNLVTDLDLLREKIKEIGNVVLIVIDPMSAYVGVGQIDSYRTTDVRGMLGPLKEFAEEIMACILGVMHFNKKADIHNAMLRIADSLAYVAAARHCYVVVDDAENHRRLFVKAKNNLAPDMAALSYTVNTKKVGNDPDTDVAIFAPFVTWGNEHVNVTATEAMQAEEKSVTSTKPRDTAKELLSSLLALGPMKQTDVLDAAKANLVSEKTLRRAKDELGIKPRKDGGRGPWLWEMPANQSGHLGKAR